MMLFPEESVIVVAPAGSFISQSATTDVAACAGERAPAWSRADPGGNQSSFRSHHSFQAPSRCSATFRLVFHQANAFRGEPAGRSSVVDRRRAAGRTVERPDPEGWRSTDGQRVSGDDTGMPCYTVDRSARRLTGVGNPAVSMFPAPVAEPLLPGPCRRQEPSRLVTRRPAHTRRARRGACPGQHRRRRAPDRRRVRRLAHGPRSRRPAHAHRRRRAPVPTRRRGAPR
jgi:hypothetical protein